MKTAVIFLLLPFLFIACKKDKDPEDKVMNGVHVNTAISKFNSYRTLGITNYPAVNAVSWNDTLSLAAFNFAKAKAEDNNTPANNYFLSSGQMILDFPSDLNYAENANFALSYDFPADADVNAVISAGFASTDPTILSGLMSSSARRFGMGQYGGRWYLIMSN